MPDRIDTDLQFDHLVVELEAGVPQGGEVFAVVGGMRREIVDIEVEFAEDTDCGSGADVVINLQTGDPDDADPLAVITLPTGETYSKGDLLSWKAGDDEIAVDTDFLEGKRCVLQSPKEVLVDYDGSGTAVSGTLFVTVYHRHVGGGRPSSHAA